MALLKFYRGAQPAAEVGKIWFDTTTNVIKVCTAAPEGAEATWESYGLSEAEIAALILAAKNEVLGTLEDGDSATLAALNDEIDALQAELAALADRLDIVEGEATVEGSIKKALADAKAYTDEAKAALLGDATEAGNTLGKLEDRIETIVANEKTYSIAKVESGLGENVKEAYKLVDEDGTQVGETINIYKDSSLISVDLVDADAEGKAGQYIKYVYVLANGNESVQYVDVSRLLVEAEFKNGLEVSQAGEVSVKVDAASEAFLTVGADGVKLSGVQDAIDAAKGEAVAAIAPAIAALDADVTSAATYTVTDEEGVESTVDHKVRVQVVEVDGVVTGVNVTESDIASAAKLHEVEYVASAALNALNERVTPLEASVADHEARLTQVEADIDALEGALANKNVDAESTTPDYVTASAADNKVTVAATQKVIDAVASAESAVQTVTSDNACLVATKTGTDVAMSLVWEEF